MNKTKLDVMDILAGAEQKSSKSKVIEYPNRVPNVSELVEAEKQLSEIDAKIKIIQDEIKNLVEEYYYEQAGKRYDPSLRVFGLGDDSLTITWQSRWTKIGMEFKDQLVEIVKDMYDSLFKTKIKIEVKDTENESLLKSLIEKIGQEDFAKYFTVKREIVPTEKYLKERYKLLNKDQITKLSQIVRQVVSFRTSEGG